MSAALYKEFVLRNGGVWAALIEFVKTHAKACVDQGAPLRVIVTAEERKRNAEQNRYYWSAVLRLQPKSSFSFSSSLGRLQQDVDARVCQYNEQRPHTGNFCFGNIPLQTFIDRKPIAFEKQLDQAMPTMVLNSVAL
ncbi:hypothetical protein CAGGBEG34_210002 [Candidatus Glomeribacter gigasporarum BEG34]|uniref:Uncharacterized protein n=1 Tax=Candidatus Glomeribacter gigasporarum BEG34 TaxID=1070319 RepID=G2J8P5_9BURK|nr:hypothetical protein [Candidatus Glomeribacter gigasporarum]CCD29142.1 hypothetical protein CAGGBEG34_210002 [Candidatus Glomeribacter gigasporarum BEG34]